MGATLLKSKWVSRLTLALAVAFLPASAEAVPILQLYVEGSTYDHESESWVFDASSGDPIRLWVIGNVEGGGGQGTIYDVKVALAYEDSGTPITFTLTPSTTGGFNGVTDPSTPIDPIHTQTVSDGSSPTLNDGSSLSSHGIYGPGVVWQEFLLGDFSLTDSPIGDFIGDFPTEFPGLGQINVYELTVVGALASLHIDAYDHVISGTTARAVFAPFSHDAEVNLTRVPEPMTLTLFVVGLLGLALLWRRRGSG